MNITTILGFLVATVVIYSGVIAHAAKPELFLDSHAMILVLGGTLAAAMIAFPGRRLFNIFKLVLYGVILKRKTKHRELVLDIVLTSMVYRHNAASVTNRRASHPFLQEGYRLIAENVLSDTELRDVLQRRSKFFKKSYTDDTKLLLAIAKFPPAFGLLGATSGMIAMMTNLGKGGQEAIGPAMAVALVATFWGIAMANLIFLPLADFTAKSAEDDTYTRQLIIEGILLIRQKHSDVFVVETLNSYLSIPDRMALAAALSQREIDEEKNSKEPPTSDQQKPNQRTGPVPKRAA